MRDERLRQLERAWRLSGSERDECAWLAERARLGQLKQGSLQLAAYCLHPAAGQACLRLGLSVASPDEEHGHLSMFVRDEARALAAWVLGLAAFSTATLLDATTLAFERAASRRGDAYSLGVAGACRELWEDACKQRVERLLARVRGEGALPSAKSALSFGAGQLCEASLNLALGFRPSMGAEGADSAAVAVAQLALVVLRSLELVGEEAGDTGATLRETLAARALTDP